jgi:succinate-semialdehyde dehydrogenase/glutarate-semialdehyde dehydrogenase
MKTLPERWFETSNWIDNQWIRGPESFDVSNPATGGPIAQVWGADPSLLDHAVHGALQALSAWSASSAIHRSGILKRVASLLLERKDQYARLLTSEQGKPYAQSIAEVEYAASFFQWFGEEARRMYGRIAPHPDAKREVWIERRAVGVAGLITPWNFPLAQGAKKISAALAAGCTAVWKPAERTPLIALAMAPLFKEAGVPQGVVQIVPGAGTVLGKPLAMHPDVRVLSLTGSTRTGAAVLANAASAIKRVALELGGNAPFIVLPDADIEMVAEQLVRMKLFVSGQVCVTANRVFVHRSSESKLLDLVAQRIEHARVGNGLDEGIDAGPLIHREACEGVDRLVQQAIDQGAEVIARNTSYEMHDSLQGGSFYPPTLLSNVTDAMPIARNEIFGPVIPVLRYTEIADMIRRANETPFGLAGYVYGTDLSICHAVARRLEVGIVGINEWRPLRADIPFGGVKQSGFGLEGGEEGLHDFLTTHVISAPKPGF